MARICNLPLVTFLDAEELEVFCVTNMVAEAFDGGKRLFPTQAAAIRAFSDEGGGFFPIGVGWGKTLISLACADRARNFGVQRSILLIPSEVVGQLWNHDLRWARAMMPLSTQFHLLAGRSASARRAFAQSGYPGCYILPYSLLSQPDCLDLFHSIQPGLVIADEAHRLRNPRAARTKRVLEMIDEFEARFVAMSGTMTNKGLVDYHHLVSRALKDRSPLPRLTSMVWMWDQVLSSKASDEAAIGPAAHHLKPILSWAADNFPAEKFKDTQMESFRRAFRLRLQNSPGVVSTGENEIGVSLQIRNEVPSTEHCRKERLELEDVIIQVTDQYLTPNGDEIEHAFHVFKWVSELTAGFYYKMTWPDAPTLATRRGISVGEAAELLERAKLWHAATQKLHRLEREFFKRSPAGLDTPREIGRSMAKHGARDVGEALYGAWCDQKALDFLGRPERDRSVVRICDYKVKHARKWYETLLAEKRGPGALLWYYHQEVGDWLVETLKDHNVLHAPAGDNEGILDPANASRPVVASLTAHGTGKNLQAFQEQLYVQWPRDAKVIEQSLGRTHRNGQMADELVAYTCRENEHDDVVFAAGLNDSIYVQQTTGARQKVIIARHDPMPRIFSPEFLRERGANPKMLTKEQREMLLERFAWDADSV